MRPEPRVRTALLLAAGAGSRLDASPQALPKCLAQVAGRSILHRQLEALVATGIKRLVIVTGYRGCLVEQAAARWKAELDIEVLVNEAYADTQNIVSLWLARERVEAPFLLLESDLLFEPRLLEPLLVPDRIAVSALTDWMRGTRVLPGAGNRIAGFRFPPFCSAAGQLKTVNIYSFSQRAWQHLIDRLERHVAAGNVGVFYEYALAELVDEGLVALEMVEFPADRWYEVDTRQDLEAADARFTELEKERPTAETPRGA